MPLYWLVTEHEGERLVYIQEASALVIACMKAKLNGHDGIFVEAHELDAKMTRKIPKKMIGRVLSQEEATELLERLG
jgi:hypothetical protein